VPASHSQFWLAPDSTFLSEDPSTISGLFSRDPGLPMRVAVPSPMHLDDGDESEDDVEGNGKDRIVVELRSDNCRPSLPLITGFSAKMIHCSIPMSRTILMLLLNLRKTQNWLDMSPLWTMGCGTPYYLQNSPISHIWCSE